MLNVIPPQAVINLFCTSVIESVLTSSVTVWYRIFIFITHEATPLHIIGTQQKESLATIYPSHLMSRSPGNGQVRS